MKRKKFHRIEIKEPEQYPYRKPGRGHSVLMLESKTIFEFTFSNEIS